MSSSPTWGHLLASWSFIFINMLIALLLAKHIPVHVTIANGSSDLSAACRSIRLPNSSQLLTVPCSASRIHNSWQPDATPFLQSTSTQQ